MKTITLEGTVGADGQLTPDSIDELRAKAARQAAQLPLEERAEALEAFEKMIEQTRSQGLLTASAASAVTALERAREYLARLPNGMMELARALSAIRQDTGREAYTLGTVAAQLSIAGCMVQTSLDDLKELVESGVLDRREQPAPSAGTPS
jgi:Fic family protein